MYRKLQKPDWTGEGWVMKLENQSTAFRYWERNTKVIDNPVDEISGGREADIKTNKESLDSKTAQSFSKNTHLCLCTLQRSVWWSVSELCYQIALDVVELEEPAERAQPPSVFRKPVTFTSCSMLGYLDLILSLFTDVPSFGSRCLDELRCQHAPIPSGVWLFVSWPLLLPL